MFDVVNTPINHYVLASIPYSRSKSLSIYERRLKEYGCDQMSRANLYVARRRELVMARRTADIANAVQSAKCCLLAGLVRASDDGRAWCLNAAATLSLT